MSMYLDHHHRPKQRRPWHRLTRAEDEYAYSYRYHLKRAEVQALKKAAERERALEVARLQSGHSWLGFKLVQVKTHGECLPASGVMLWKGAGFALVWFDGSDAPMVWPVADIEVAAE